MADPRKQDPWHGVGTPIKAPTDWSKQPWPTVASEAARNAIPSTAKAAWEGVLAVPHLAQQIAMAAINEPKAAGEYWGKRGIPAPNPIVGAAAPIAHQLTGLAGATKDYFSGRYGSIPALKNTVATDPGGALMDVAGAASIPAGGEGLAARVPGVAGDVLQGITRASRIAGELTNPIHLPLKAAQAGIKGAQSLVRGSPFKGGEFTPKALDAVIQAFPNGEVGPNELADPAFKDTLTQTFKAKGITPAAVKEAVLTHNGAPTSRALTNQAKAPSSAVAAAGENKADAQSALESRAQILTGDLPDPNAFGSAFKDAHAASRANIDALYKTAGSHEDLKLQPVFHDILNDNIASTFADAKLPTPDRMATLGSYPHTLGALDATQNDVANLASTDSLSLQNLEHLRQSYNYRWPKADGTDARAITAMKEALDRSIGDTLDHGLVSAGNPDHVSGDFAAARQANAEHMQTFENPKTAPSPIKQAVKVLGDTSDVADPGALSQAQDILTKGMFNPSNLRLTPGGEKLYGTLSGILGDDGRDALNNHIRSMVLNSGAKPDQVRDFLLTPVGQQSFSPEDVSQARLLAAGQDVVGAKPASGDSPFSDVIGKTGRVLAAAGLGAEGLGAVHGPIGRATGAVLGALAERTGERILGGVDVMREGAGAPAQAGWMDAPAGVAGATAKASKSLPTARLAEGIESGPPAQEDNSDDSGPVVTDITQDPTAAPPIASPQHAAGPQADPWAGVGTPEADGGRVERASGGGVSHDIENLVDRLEAEVKRARKAEKGRTEPLLSVPDSTVIKALRVAQKAMA